MLHLTLRQLRVFEAVANHLSYSRAAETLHLTQPAVSMQIKQLEQSAGLKEINRAMGQMDMVTQQNAAMVEQTTAASQNFAEEMEALAKLIKYFKVGAECESQKPPKDRSLQAAASSPDARTSLKRVSLKEGGWENF